MTGWENRDPAGTFRRFTTSLQRRPSVSPIRHVAFHRTKYGRELLIDVARVRDMPAFIADKTPHALGFFDIMLVTRGRGIFLLDGQAHDVRPGLVLFTAPGQVREWDVSDLDGVCLFFAADFIADFLNDRTFLERLPYFTAAPGGAALRLPPRAALRLRRGLTRMRREIAGLKPDIVHLLRARLYETLVTLGRWYAARHKVSPERPTNTIVTQYRALIDERVMRQHTVAAFARDLGVSPGHLNALCRKYAGASAKQMIEQALTTRARRLLAHSSDSAARIGEQLGFEDPSYFSRFVRKATGRSPSSFRRSHKA